MHPITLAILNAFIERLSAFDWKYEYSDDHSVWTRCHTQHQQIIEITKSHPILKRAYDAYSTYNFGPGTYQDRLPALKEAIAKLREELQPMPMAA